jgi:hypothetical protein
MYPIVLQYCIYRTSNYCSSHLNTREDTVPIRRKPSCQMARGGAIVYNLSTISMTHFCTFQKSSSSALGNFTIMPAMITLQEIEIVSIQVYSRESNCQSMIASDADVLSSTLTLQGFSDAVANTEGVQTILA